MTSDNTINLKLKYIYIYICPSIFFFFKCVLVPKNKYIIFNILIKLLFSPYPIHHISIDF